MSQTMPEMLSDEERRALACVAGLMIPASAEYGVPGADDDAILADMVASLGRDGPAVRAALARLDALAGGRFAGLAAPERAAVAARLRAEGCPAVATLNRVVLQCYYRDDRVLASLGIEPRAPFPKGHALEQGDWSLLEPVRRRGKLWRDAP